MDHPDRRDGPGPGPGPGPEPEPEPEPGETIAADEPAGPGAAAEVPGRSGATAEGAAESAVTPEGAAESAVTAEGAGGPGARTPAATSSPPASTEGGAELAEAVVLEDGSEAVPTAAVAVPVGVEHGSAAGDRSPAPAGRGAIGLLGYLVAAIAGAAIVAVAFIGSGAASLGPGPTPSPEPTFAMSDASVGVAGAPVTIEIWADYQCPYCGLFTHGIEPSILRDYAATGRAIVTFRDYAFLGQESIDAAVAARCADRQGAFWTYHDLLFASQSGENRGAFARGNLDKLAAFAGLDTAAFATCMSDATVSKAIADEKTVGEGLGITSTPTVRITGPGGEQLLKGIVQPATIAAAVDQVAKPAPSGSAGASSAPSASPGAGVPGSSSAPSASPGGG
jgi:protein-disulfide isomerase